MRRSLSAEIREELVKRFEDVVKSEIRDHNLALIKHNKDLEKLNSFLSSLRVDQESLKQETNKSYLISQKNMFAETKRLEDGFEYQRRHIKESRNIVKDKVEEFEIAIGKCIGVECFDTFAKQVNKRFEDLDKKLETCKRYSSEEVYEINMSISKNLESLENHNKELTNKLEKYFNILTEKINTYKVDASGVIREFDIFKKDLFIMEKKIENLYTLVSRVNKRLDSCPKPD